MWIILLSPLQPPTWQVLSPPTTYSDGTQADSRGPRRPGRDLAEPSWTPRTHSPLAVITPVVSQSRIKSFANKKCLPECLE